MAEPYDIILPSNAQDVSNAIGTIRALNATFSVRAGGHSPNPGWSSIGKGGILVDLQQLNQVTLSEDKSVVSVGPGARWGAVQGVLGKQNITAVGGRDDSIGVGCLLLGGKKPGPF